MDRSDWRGPEMMMLLAAYCRRRALGVALRRAAPQSSPPDVYDGVPTDPAPATPSVPEPVYTYPAVTTPNPSAGVSQAAANPSVAAAQGDTYKEDDLIGAAEGVFGKGAEGLAR